MASHDVVRHSQDPDAASWGHCGISHKISRIFVRNLLVQCCTLLWQCHESIVWYLSNWYFPDIRHNVSMNIMWNQFVQYCISMGLRLNHEYRGALAKQAHETLGIMEQLISVDFISVINWFTVAIKCSPTAALLLKNWLTAIIFLRSQCQFSDAPLSSGRYAKGTESAWTTLHSEYYKSPWMSVLIWS